MRGIHRSPVDSPHKGPVTRKPFPFDAVIMGMKTFWQGTSFCITDDVWQKGPVMHCFNIFIVVSLNKMLNKHPNCQWFESLWRNGLSAEIQPLTYVHGQYCNNFHTRNKKNEVIWWVLCVYIKKYVLCILHIHYKRHAHGSRFFADCHRPILYIYIYIHAGESLRFLASDWLRNGSLVRGSVPGGSATVSLTLAI